MTQDHLIWAEIDLKRIAHNVRELRRVTQSQARLMAVVKANAYGHGAFEVATCALNNGAEVLGVARIGEAIELRRAGIAAPLLIMGYTPVKYAGDIIKWNLIQAVNSVSLAEGFSAAAQSKGTKIKIHTKVDTGMGRLGLPAVTDQLNASGEILKDIQKIANLPGIELEGIFTHFATSDSADKSYAERQFDLFTNLLHALETTGVQIPIRHAANSGAIIDLPQTHLDMVRAGISLYGLYPSDEVNKNTIDLQPAMQLKAKIIQIKQVPAGFKVSYGCTFETPSPTTIATVPVGYADGLNRLLSSNATMLAGGQKVPVVGRVCMDLTMLDVGQVPDLAVEDEVVIFGHQGDQSITVDEIAQKLQTINYEIVSTITARVPRVYIR